MLSVVKADIKKYGMITAGDTVTVALSGGADSVALLYVLYTLREELNITLKAVHINHMLRGEESDRDEAFVRELCAGLSIPLIVEKIDVGKLAVENKESTELAARRARYAVFDSISGKIATAHTATDNAETVLFNIARGTSLKGACGIPAVRGKFIRPLISLCREDTEKYCKSVGAKYVTDSTNLTDEYTRNKIRHTCVPVLKNINPEFDSAVRRFSVFAEQDNDYLDGVADNLYNICVSGDVLTVADGIHPAILNRIVGRFITGFVGKFADSSHILSIINALGSDTSVSLPGDCIALISKNTVTLFNSKKPVDNKFTANMREMTYCEFEKKLKVNSLLLKNSVDCDKIVGNCVLRQRQSGDFVHIFGRNAGKSLKKLYNEEKIPLCDRNNLPVAADGIGVIWIHKIGVEQRVAVDNNTKRVIVFTAEEDNNLQESKNA